jgi:MFS family permease
MFLEIPFLVLIPTMCYTGLFQGFVFGAIPPLIINKSRKFLMFALYGIVNACGSMFFGKLSDYLARRPLIFAIGGFAHMIIFGLLLIIWKPPLDENRIEIFVIMISCLSIGDSIFMTQLYSIVAIFYGETRPAEAFAYVRVFQAGCTAIGFVGQVYFPYSVQILCLLILLSWTLITLIYAHYRIISLDTGKRIISMKKQNKNKIETEVQVEIPLTTLCDTA